MSYNLTSSGIIGPILALLAVIAVVWTARSGLRRRGYLIGFLLVTIATAVFFAVEAAPGDEHAYEVNGVVGFAEEGDVHAAVLGWIMVALALVRLCLVAHRLIDWSKSRWWSLVSLLPVIGFIFAVVLIFPKTRMVRPQDTAAAFD